MYVAIYGTSTLNGYVPGHNADLGTCTFTPAMSITPVGLNLSWRTIIQVFNVTKIMIKKMLLRFA